jgi:hypothetical protein
MPTWHQKCKIAVANNPAGCILLRFGMPKRKSRMNPLDYNNMQDGMDDGSGSNSSISWYKMRPVHIWVSAILVLSAAVGLAARQTGKQQSGPPEAKPSAPKTASAVRASEPKPSPQITKLLQAFSGAWSIKEKLAPDGAFPNGTAGVGKIVWSAGPGGFSVVENYRSKEGDRTITGLGVFWWDEAAQGYRTIWCDSTNPGGCINFKNVAKWDGSQLVLVEGYEVKGQRFTFKEVFSDISPAAFTQTLYGAKEGGELKVDQTIRATKLARAGLGKGQQQ